jgi:hypothetical protein
MKRRTRSLRATATLERERARGVARKGSREHSALVGRERPALALLVVQEHLVGKANRISRRGVQGDRQD